MQRIPVASSNVHAIGYDPDGKVLEVEFNDGSVYQYYNVPAAIHAGIMSAPSKGSYLHSHVKSAYSYRRIH